MEYDDRVCIGSILGKYYTETGTKPEDAENFVDYARSFGWGGDWGITGRARW